MRNPFTNWGLFKKQEKNDPKKEEFNRNISGISPGRVSVPDDRSMLQVLKGQTRMVTPSFRREVIPLIRDLYKVNPDVSIALQDMFKLANTGHDITFPNNEDKEADKMREHLRMATKRWSMYTSGIDGLVNKMIVQLLIGGAISVEGVPNKDLSGLSTILFIKPEDIYFERDNEGVYHPYQINHHVDRGINKDFIKLNTDTYVYSGMYNDTDEPYGIPPFLASLDSLKSQQDMKINFKHIMEMVGMVGFLEAKMAKPDQLANESERAYSARLNRMLRELKKNLKEGMKDGVVTGYIDDHEFKLNSTTKELSNLSVPWDMNQQSVANGLGINGAIIGTGNSTEASTGVNLSKMISQLKVVQSIVSYVLEFLYSLELRLAGFDNKGMTITWGTTTITDDVKVQQARQYKIQNLDLLYKAGIISQSQYAWEMGYDSPDQEDPRVPLVETDTTNSDPQEMTKKKQRQSDKNQSARRSRTKTNPNPSRGDTNSKPV
jgi:hypothetical protein